MFSGITRVGKSWFLKVGFTEFEIRDWAGGTDPYKLFASVRVKDGVFYLEKNPAGKRVYKNTPGKAVVAVVSFRATNLGLVETPVRFHRLEETKPIVRKGTMEFSLSRRFVLTHGKGNGAKDESLANIKQAETRPSVEDLLASVELLNGILKNLGRKVNFRQDDRGLLEFDLTFKAK